MPSIIPITFDSYLGYSSTGAVESEYGGISGDTALNSRVQSVGKRLAPQTEFRRDVPYQFKVLDTNTVNAFALPGGPVYATKGLMGMTSNDDELASVVAHELGHINARHSINSMQLSLGLTVIDKAVRSYLKKSDKLDLSPDELENLKKIDSTLIGFANLGYSRDNEYEADARGLGYANSAGYNPYGMVSFMSKLQSMEGRDPTKLEEFFSTHPSTKKRISEMNDIIARNYPNAKPLIESAGQLVVPGSIINQVKDLWAKPAIKWSAIGIGAVAITYGVYRIFRKKPQITQMAQINKNPGKKEYTVDEWIEEQKQNQIVPFEFNKDAVREYLERLGIFRKPGHGLHRLNPQMSEEEVKIGGMDWMIEGLIYNKNIEKKLSKNLRDNLWGFYDLALHHPSHPSLEEDYPKLLKEGLGYINKAKKELGIKTNQQLIDLIEKEYGIIKGNPQIPRMLEPLAQEARKYKTAEEFVNKIIFLKEEIRGARTWKDGIRSLPKEDRFLAEVAMGYDFQPKIITSFAGKYGVGKKAITDFYNQVTKGGTTQKLPQVLEPLIQEARKYKSADEFPFEIDITDLSTFKSPNAVRKQYRYSEGDWQYNIRKEPNSGYSAYTRNLKTGEQIPFWRVDKTKMDNKGDWKTLKEAKQQLTDFYATATARNPVPKELEPLAIEARKYKSAEEFAKDKLFNTEGIIFQKENEWIAINGKKPIETFVTTGDGSYRPAFASGKPKGNRFYSLTNKRTLTDPKYYEGSSGQIVENKLTDFYATATARNPSHQVGRQIHRLKITDQIDKLQGVEKSYWNFDKNELTIYYDEKASKETVHTKVVKWLSDNRLYGSINKIKMISTPKGTFAQAMAHNPSHQVGRQISQIESSDVFYRNKFR